MVAFQFQELRGVMLLVEKDMVAMLQTVPPMNENPQSCHVEVCISKIHLMVCNGLQI